MAANQTKGVRRRREREDRIVSRLIRPNVEEEQGESDAETESLGCKQSKESKRISDEIVKGSTLFERFKCKEQSETK
jgi:hypothetical protein